MCIHVCIKEPGLTEKFGALGAAGRRGVCIGFRVWGLGFRGLGFRVWGLGLGFWCSAF